MPDPNPTQIVPSNTEQSSIQTIEAPQSPFMNRVEPIQKSTSILNWESSPKPVIQQSTKGSEEEPLEEPHCCDNCICTCWLKGRDPYYNHNFTRAQRLEAGANCWDCCCCPHNAGDLSGAKHVFPRATTKLQKNILCCIWISPCMGLFIMYSMLRELEKQSPKAFWKLITKGIDKCVGKCCDCCDCCKDTDCSCDCNICSEVCNCFCLPCNFCYEKCC